MIDTSAGELLSNEELLAQYIRGLQPKNILKIIWRNITGSSPEQLAWLHTNHLGAPQAATATDGQVLWQASYAAFGAARTVGVSGFTQNLRLPGQYFDAETGLHYNRHRYYDPARGEYLTPDPLGTPDGPNPYAYVRYNPLKYVDPDGLILFAFDGTGNTEASKTNVYWLQKAYNDNDVTKNADGSLLFENTAAKPFYIEGPGTGQFLDGALAYSLRGRIDTQLDRLDEYVKAKWQNEIDVQKKSFSKEAPLIITLDIMGFSRGAAAARDFANQVIDRKNRNYYNKDLFGFGSQNDTRYNCVGIKLRFMGLFDTVLSTAVGNFDTGISNSQIEYVAQAVAVNEHRAKFPLLSIDDSAGGAGFTANRVEKGFIGAHSDIGGGYAGSGGDGGDLSDVALNWMHAQAGLAGVTLEALKPDQLKVTNPILHDETRVAPWIFPGLGGLSSDRTITYLDQSSAKMKAAQTEGMTYTQSQQGQTDSQDKYINYYNYYAGNKAGLVDMDKYKQWLQGQGVAVQ